MSFERHTISALAFSAMFIAVGQAVAQNAQVQFIHASPYPEAQTVDVYIGGELKLDDFKYGSATPFTELPASVYLTIEVTPGEDHDSGRSFHTSTVILTPYPSMPSASRAGIAVGTKKFFPKERRHASRSQGNRGEEYLIVLAGDPLSRADQPGFDLFLRTGAQDVSAASPFTETVFFVAAPVAEPLNIRLRTAKGRETVIRDLGFSDFSSRVELAAALYDLDLTTAEDSLIHSFVQDYHYKASEFVVNVVSGFDMRDGFTVFRDGTTTTYRANSAFVQFIHNSPYSAADSVDVYLNDRLKLDNLAFRQATAFIEVPAGLNEETAPPLKIDIKRAGDPDNGAPLLSQDAKYTFGRKYVSVLGGDPERKEDRPSLELFTHSQVHDRASVPGFVDLLFFNGSSDVPFVAIDLEGSPGFPLVRHLGFGGFEPYKPLPPVDITMLVFMADHRKLIARVDAPLGSMGLEDSALVVLTSGFSGSTDAADGLDREFGLFAALPSGGELISFEATIPLPWWRSPWAIPLGLIALVGIVVIGAQLRIRRLRARERELSALVAERTKDLEAEKRKTEEQAHRLVELDQAKNRFFANISHEFRTPIALILGPLQDLLDGLHGEVSSQAQEQIHAMRRSAQRLMNLISQLLDLSRMDAGKLEIHCSEVDLVAHLQELVRAFVPMAERKQITLAFRHEADELHCGTDPDMLDKVFGNLISNAIKFTPVGGKVWVSMNLPTGDKPSTVEVLVKDTGRGITREHLAHIFERFSSFEPESGDSTLWARSHEGIGIGLSVAKELVELLEGVILVESEPGFGTTFTVRLPLKPVPSDVTLKSVDPRTGVRLSSGLEEVVPKSDGDTTAVGYEEEARKKLTILIAEDSAEMRSYLRIHLEGDYGIVEAANGREALQEAKNDPPDLVIADVMMPVMDGYSLCRELKSNQRLRNVPVIILTARAGEESTLEGLESGADDYIPKPFSMPELKARVANLIEARLEMRRQFSKEIVVEPAGISVTSEEEVFVKRVLDVIEANLGNSGFGIDWLADEVGMSPRHLRRRVEETIGEPPAELIRRLRLERASQLLRAEAGTVAEIAYRVGFKSPSHFSSVFREAFGVSPSELVEHEPRVE